MSKWEDGKRNGEIVESEIVCGRFRLSVHHYIGNGEVWFASCHGLMHRITLTSPTIGGAKKEAKIKLKEILKTAINELA